MIYAVGDVSGAHINPAVTFGFWFAGRLPRATVLPYVIQSTRGRVRGQRLNAVAIRPHHAGRNPPRRPADTIVLEIVLTAMLMFVILGVAIGPKEKGLLAGVAIGGVIAFEAMFAGPICGESMNPARSIAPAVLSGAVVDLWIYIAGPIIGAAIGVLSNRVIE
jgi:aquaporin NIP